LEIKRYIRSCLHLFLLILFFTGCEKFEGEQTVPSYLKIDAVKLTDNPGLTEGRLTHNFTDVWVYVDEQVIGAFELPATIPVLVEGPHKLTVFGGIKYNSMSGTRGPYTFTSPMIIEDYNFIKDSVKDILKDPESRQSYINVQYADNTDFVWIDEFDFSNPDNVNLIASSSSDTTMSEFNRSADDPLFERLGFRSGIGYVDARNTVFEVTTQVEPENGFTFPAGSSPVILELEFNCSNQLLVGLFIRDEGIIQHPVLLLKPTNGEWKKTYVNFTPTISNNSQALNFNVFFRADYDGTSDVGVIMLDNIKLLRKE